MILKHPNYSSKKIPIYYVRMTHEQYLQRRMFNQKRIVNMLPQVHASNSIIIRETAKLNIMKREVMG